MFVSASAQWSGSAWLTGSTGGSAHSSGVEAIYQNPSRIMINRYKNGNEILLGSFAGLQTDRSLTLSTDAFKQIAAPFDDANSSAEHLPYSANDHYISRTILSSIPFGLVIQDDAWSISLSVQQRNERELIYSDISELLETSATPTSLNADFNEIQYSRFTFGFAQPIKYLNGLESDLGHWYMGTSLSYVQIHTFNQLSLSQKLMPQSSGNSINVIGEYTSVTEPDFPDQKSLTDSFSDQVGYGVLMDFGISFVQPLGDDISLIQSDSTALKRSFSLSLGLRNIGFTSLKKGSFQQRSLSTDTVSVNADNLISPDLFSSPSFSSSDLTYMQLLQTFGDSVSYQSQSITSNTSLPEYIIPWQFTVGAALDYNWFAVFGDLLIDLNEFDSFSLNNIRLESGLELSIIPLFDLRSGVSLKSEDFNYYSLGATLNMGHLLIESAFQYRISGQDGMNPQSVAITGLKIRF